MLRALFRAVPTASRSTITRTAVRCASSDVPDRKSLPYVKQLFFGNVDHKQVFPFPISISDDEKASLELMLDPVRKFFADRIDSTRIDLDHNIPKEVIEGLGGLGLFGLQIPVENGGLGLSNTSYARMMEEVVHDASVAVTLMAHQSIGLKGIIMFGNEQQKAKYLPKLASGEEIAAFALTEPTAGSDAASIKTRAVLSPDGKHYILNGSKQWISNGGIANVYTLFAQTPMPDGKDKITAFIIERGFNGISTGKPETKLGIRGSNTTTVTFEDTKVPVENVLGEVGGGFKVAVRILNNGRFGMGAGTASGIRKMVQLISEHAIARKQFGRPLKDFALIQEKFANMAVMAYAAESMAYMTTAMIDSSGADRELEAAICKIYGSESMWYAVNECIQILGGMGFMAGVGAFPFERIMRDARILMIFEGTNEILRMLVALTGFQNVGKELSNFQKMTKDPFPHVNEISDVLVDRIKRRFNDVFGSAPAIPGVHSELASEAKKLVAFTSQLGFTVDALAMKHGKNIVDKQLLLQRIANIVIDLYGVTAVISRVSSNMPNRTPEALAHEVKLAKLFCVQANRRIAQNFAGFRASSTEDKLITSVAHDVLSAGKCVAGHPLGI